MTKHKLQTDNLQPNGGKNEFETKHKKQNDSPQSNGGMDEFVTKHNNPPVTRRPNGDKDNDEFVTKHKKLTSTAQRKGREGSCTDEHKEVASVCRRVEADERRERRRRRWTRVMEAAAGVYDVKCMKGGGETRSTIF